MGQPMAANLAKEGFAVRSFDLNGTGSSPSVRDAAAGAEVMITMLPDGEAVRKAVLEALPALDSGTVVVDMSSSDPAATRALGTMLAARGIELVDAPVSGAVPKAIDGTLTIMAGGNAATLKRITPLLEKMGDRVFHVGPLGAGHAVKALNNYLGAAGTLAGFEALLIARAYGLDPKPMLEAINASTGRNSATERKIPQQVLTGAFASGFRLALMVKDVGIAYRLARELGIDAPYLREALKLWRDAERHLPADADHTRAYEYLKRRSAPARRKPAPSRGARARRSSPRRSPRRST
ncbi:MAG: NAD(P)-dependent oxidoreductase [Betaproteobacteria bacterium]|nr:MAG: NAD(P)-dependent oxidoreductase [Betaproteobacteria bacterium]